MFEPMGRGGGNWSTAAGPRGLSLAAFNEPDPELRACLGMVEGRIHSSLGLSIEHWGRLAQAEAGHTPGTAFVTISADCRDEVETARSALAEIAGLTDLAWDYGWERVLLRGRSRLILRLFPTSSADGAGST